MEGKKIYPALIAVMREIQAIEKTHNAKQGYQFRGIDDVYNDIQPLLAAQGIITVPELISEKSEERTSNSGGALIYRILTIKYHFIADDGSEVCAVVTGEGMDSGDKASNKAQAVAHKYALTQTFCVPTKEAKDPENDNPDPLPKRPTTEKSVEPEKVAPIKTDFFTVEKITKVGAVCKIYGNGAIYETNYENANFANKCMERKTQIRVFTNDAGVLEVTDCPF